MNEFFNKNVLVMGLARSGLAAINLLLKLGAKVTVTEAKPLDKIPEYAELTAKGVKVCNQTPEVFEKDYCLAVKNPGIHPDLWFVKRLKERCIDIITEIELGFRVCAEQHFIAVTGTNGKTTTATLLYEVLNRAFPGKAHLSGNIGIALCDTLMQYNLLNESGHYIVLEISNFQLMDIEKFRPEVAVIINLAPDHLDFMGSEDAYYRSKCRVYENMNGNDIFLKNADDGLIGEYIEKLPVHCRQITYSVLSKNADVYADETDIYVQHKYFMPLSAIKVVGRHNVQNVLVAVAAAKAVGADDKSVKEAIADFKGVEHRIEFVREINGVKYYNDSKGTNVDATVIALKAFSQPTILLAGGHEKGLSFEPLKDCMTNVKQVIGYGECGARLIRELTDNRGILVQNLEQALTRANEIAKSGDVVLLSPTTSSFDQYSCFEERGEHFKKLVNAIE